MATNWINPESNEDDEIAGLTTGAMDFLSNQGNERFFDSRMKQINSMKQSALAAVSNQIHSGYARQMQTLRDTHRRYGITGAVAEAQLQDLTLKKNDQLSELQAKTAIEFDKQFENEMTSLNAMKSKSLEATKTSIINSLTNNSISSVESFKELLVKNNMLKGLEDRDIRSIWKNKDRVKNIIKGNLL